MISLRKQTNSALLYLLLAAVFGLLLRLFPISDFTFNYRFIVHTHSHIALLGWVYIALTTLLFKIGNLKNPQKYQYIFWSTQLSIVGMLLTFPFVGYALFSILFSTLFILCSYWFYHYFKKNNQLNKSSYAYKFINASLLFMVLSSIGPWSLGIIMNTLGNTSHWYKNAIYFYLHFQYNGWFIFCLIGSFLFFIEQQQIRISQNALKWCFQLMFTSCILTLLLSFLWISPPLIVYILAGLGAVIQLIAFTFFYKSIAISFKRLKDVFGHFNVKVLQFVLVLFLLKKILQLMNAIPTLAEVAYKFIYFVIGYLHLTFLGIITLALFVFLNYLKLIRLSKSWIRLYLIGFLGSEILIFYKGISIWLRLDYTENYFLYLVLISAFLLISILGIFIENTIKRSPIQPKLP